MQHKPLHALCLLLLLASSQLSSMFYALGMHDATRCLGITCTDTAIAATLHTHPCLCCFASASMLQVHSF